HRPGLGEILRTDHVLIPLGVVLLAGGGNRGSGLAAHRRRVWTLAVTRGARLQQIRTLQPKGTPINRACSQCTNRKYRTNPPTTAMTSLKREGGAPAIGRCSRRLNEILSATAHTRKPPNNRTSARAPFASRCASAQNFTAASIGCFAAALMRPGKYVASSRGNTGNINTTATQRDQGGGAYSTMGSMRAWP